MGLFTFFLLKLIFTLVVPSISPFLTAAIKLQTKLVSFVFLSLALARSSVIHANVEIKRLVRSLNSHAKAFRLRVFPHVSSGIVARTKRERA